MPPLFHPALVNGPFDDPAVYIDFLFERRAILFDLGDLAPLPPRKLLRLSHVFVSHTHIDHFVGFDRLVRLTLGREKRLRLFGPPGFVSQVANRLAGYSWNLVENYPTDFTIIAAEVAAEGELLTAEFHCRKEFVREGERRERLREGVLVDEEEFLVRTAPLDHGIPSLAFALEEKNHVQIMKSRLLELELPTGPWLTELKRAILGDVDPAAPFRVQWRDGATRHERSYPLGWLRDNLTRLVPGQKVVYVTDAAFTPANAAKIVALARSADYLFIETTFLDAEAERARERGHLTARQAGELARLAGVERVVPFHFSPKHRHQEELLRRELATARREGTAPAAGLTVSDRDRDEAWG
ncbi:ribonuclease Z [Geotalea uraniireducens]|uniref:Ribonuclease Z n=1 Tax=Geotalea uraniireducens TaxID=351604 RepID=A0ABN6VUB5_9BACT|nr:MBL fold metallo-hydrolase [Geotalea uraniireducens]BDV43924.1 ribonuclease Z [Geotalea uraniireducens]